MTSLITFYLTRIKNCKVIFPDKKAGILKDFLVDMDFSRPKAVAALIKTGDKSSYFSIGSISIKKENGRYLVTCNSGEETGYDNKSNLILLIANILGKKVIDINGRKLVRVNDIRMASVSSGTYAVAVDIGFEGYLRRLGIVRPVRSIFSLLRLELPKNHVMWDDVETVDPIHHDIHLSKSYTKLKTLHPSDIADIIEELDKNARTKIFVSLDEEHAADVLEQMEVAAQVDLIENLPVEKAADVLEKMPADEAADIIDELETVKAEELLQEMVGESSEEIRELLEYPENTVGSIMSTEFIAFRENLEATEAISQLRKLKPEQESTYLFFITDNKNRLIATLTLRDLILAHPFASLSEIMNKNLISVLDKENIDVLAEIISKYKLLAIPVTNEKRELEGMVVIDDIVEDLLKSGKTK